MAKEIKFKIRLNIDGKEQLGSVTTSVKELRQSWDNAASGAKKFEAAMFNFSNIGNVISNFSGAISSLQGQLQGLASTYQNAEVANTKLATVMKQRMEATDADVASVKKVISAQTQLGIIGGTVQKSGAQQVATFLNEAKSLEVLIPAMDNLLAQQKGVNATAEDAVGIGNLMGKAMQGQTSALRRVGITFSEAEEEVMKMGNESERAAMLAQIITNNVGNMNAELAKTDAGRLKQISNEFGSIKVKVGEIATQALPFVQMAAQSAILLSSISKLIVGLKAFNVAALATSIRTTAIPAAMKAAQMAALSLTAASRMLSAALKGTAIGATTAKVAIRGLLISSGVGAAVLVLGYALEKLIDFFTGASGASADMADSLDENEQAVKSINDTYESTLSRTFGDLMSKYDQLRAGWNALTTTQQRNDWIKQNQSAFRDLGLSINNAADAENAFNKNTDAVVAAFKKRAEAAAYSAKLTALYERQISLTDKKRDMMSSLTTGKHTEDEYAAFDKVSGDLAKINKDIDATSKRLAELSQQGGKASSSTSAKTTTGAHASRSTTSSTEKPAEAFSVDWYNKKISDLNTKINATGNQQVAAALVSTREQYENALKNLKVSIGLEQPEEKEVDSYVSALQKKLKEAQDAYNNLGVGGKDVIIEARVKASAKIDEIQAEIDAATRGSATIPAEATPTFIAPGSRDDKRQSLRNAQTRLGGIRSDLSAGIIDTSDAEAQIAELNSMLAGLGLDVKLNLDDDDAVESVKNLTWSLGNIDLTNTDDIKNAFNSIKEITDPVAQGFAAAGAACSALGSSLQQLGSDSEAAKAGMVIAAIGQIVLSFAQALTSCKTWIEWLAFGISGTAMMISLISTISGFANGGIVGGNSKSGDKLIARVNSGEMILNTQQQSRLWGIINGYNGITGNNDNGSISDSIRSYSGMQQLAGATDQTVHVELSGKWSGKDFLIGQKNARRIYAKGGLSL